MAKQGTPRIGTWPTPEQPVTIEIPPGLVKEFGKEARIVVRYPWPVGIPVPDRMLRAELIEGLKGTDLEVMIVPKQHLR